MRPGTSVRRGQSLGEVGYPPEAGDQVHIHWALIAGRRKIDPLTAGVDCVTKVATDDRTRLVYPVRC